MIGTFQSKLPSIIITIYRIIIFIIIITIIIIIIIIIITIIIIFTIIIIIIIITIINLFHFSFGIAHNIQVVQNDSLTPKN